VAITTQLLRQFLRNHNHTLDAAANTNSLLSDLLKATKTDGLVKDLALDELRDFTELMSGAASGRMKVKTPYRTFMHYRRFFDAVAKTAKMKGTTLVVPTGVFRKSIIDANNKFIQGGGEVQRIFFLPNDKDQAQKWKDYINEQKIIKVEAWYVFVNEFAGMHRDILLVDNPKMGTEAKPHPNYTEWSEVTLTTVSADVDEMKTYWEGLLHNYAEKCEPDDWLQKAFEARSSISSIGT
jgi:hypothetical protein